MATQHPDNACAPYWEKDGDGYISVQEEVEECYSALADLGCQEFMWDWEGKYVDEAVVDRLFHSYYNFFKKKQLGRDIFLTFRIPNIWQEKGHNLARALMGIITAENYARDLHFHQPPLFEVILPMTTSAEQIIHVQKTFQQMSELQKRLFKNGQSKLNHLRVLPLFESVDNLINVRKIIEKYIYLHKKEFKFIPDYLRLHIARSDPALNSGYVASVLAAKVAISEFYGFSDDYNIPVFPALGVGGLLFRGGLLPNKVDDFINEYPGVKTVYIQSAFRYDFPKKNVLKAIDKLNITLPKTKPVRYANKEIRQIKRLCKLFSEPYGKTIKKIATFITQLASFVPRRRERRLHTGLFGYSRQIGNKRLPRAIGFTSVMYSLGVPPELIGVGRGLETALNQGLNISKFLPNLRKDIMEVGRFYNSENLSLLIKSDKSWQAIAQDVDLIKKYLGINLGPINHNDMIYRDYTSIYYHSMKKNKNLGDVATRLGILRKSLG